MLNNHWNVTEVCCIYATVPFININDLRSGYATFKSGKWSYVFAATEYVYPVFRSFIMHSEGGVEMLYPQYFSKRSQDLPITLHDAAQFFWGNVNTWLEKKIVFDSHSCPIIIPNWRVCDIDTEEDWERAELMWKVLNS